MKHKNSLAPALYVLALSIILSTVIFSVTINNMSNRILNIELNNEKENIMTLDEAADYLGVMPMSLEKIIETTSIEIPYLKLEGNYIFTKNGLDSWLENNYIDLD